MAGQRDDGALIEGAPELSVGAAAARLGVAPETLRSWGRRYGLMPSSRTPGGHRRYSREDLERLIRMQRLVAEGATPAAAAREVSGGAPARPARPRAATPRPDGGRTVRPAVDDERAGRGGPGGRVLAVPGGSKEARGLARAASRLDSEAIDRILERLLAERGAMASWDEVLRPVLVAAGERWMSSGEGIEIEHLLSETMMTAYRRHQLLQPPPRPGRPVLLACYPEDLHVLPLHVLAAALAEIRVPVRQLGARVPLPALVAASRRTGAAAVFVWRQMGPSRGAPRIALPPSRPPVRLVVGGPGWAGASVEPGTRVVRDLREAVAALRDAAVAAA